MTTKITQIAGENLLEIPTRPRGSRIFVNRNLRMDSVKVIGFDMDYTLARYEQRKIEELAYAQTIKKLLKMGYPKGIGKLHYDPDFVIRGLTVDKQSGNVIKLDRHNHVGRAYHGRKRLRKPERRKLYRNKRVQFQAPRFLSVDTYFSLPEICLFADLVEYFEQCEDTSRDPWQLYDETRQCIDEVHRDGSLKSILKKDLKKYINHDPLLAPTLHKFRSAGKKLFLLTNSHWDFTNAVMTHLLDNSLPEYPSWRHYFDGIVVAGAKPDFWMRDEPLTRIDDDGHPIDRDVKKFEKGAIYQGGNVSALETAIGYNGEEILYIGDHIYGDIVRSKRNAQWRTALVVEELEEELERSWNSREDMERLHVLRQQQRELDNLCNIQRQTLSQIEKGLVKANEHEKKQIRESRNRHKKELKLVVEERDALERALDKEFNQYWGMVFKQGEENSRFGQQVQRYACLYTSRVSNFHRYSNFQYFRSPTDILPHDRE